MIRKTAHSSNTVKIRLILWEDCKSKTKELQVVIFDKVKLKVSSLTLWQVSRVLCEAFTSNRPHPINIHTWPDRRLHSSALIHGVSGLVEKNRRSLDCFHSPN